jgi:hypothetical protein
MKRLPEFCLSFSKKKRGEEPMCPNCASTVRTVQIERKGRENSHVTWFPFFTEIKTNMLLLIILGLIAKLSVSGDCDFGNRTQNNFDWYNVRINV